MSAFALAGRILVDGALVEGAVVVDGGIVDVRVPAGTLGVEVRERAIIAPGLIDLQVNGAFGDEVGGDARAIERIADALPSTGVTSWLPTVVTAPRGEYDAALRAFASIERRGADALGLHLEGPLLAAAKKGAHRDAPMDQPAALLDELAASGHVRLVTLAPEREGALDAIRALRARGVRVAIGHTVADAAQVSAAIDAGATLVTHLFNAMPPLSARAPGVIGVALVDERVTCSLIVDFVHVDRLNVELAVRTGRVCLVTDAMAAAGKGPGRYRLGGLDVVVDATSARLVDGQLAGSVLTLDQAVRNAASTSLGVPGALAAATSVPAQVLGLTDRGRLAAGLRADVVCFDDALHVVETYVAGARVFASPRA